MSVFAIMTASAPPFTVPLPFLLMCVQNNTFEIPKKSGGMIPPRFSFFDGILNATRYYLLSFLCSGTMRNHCFETVRRDRRLILLPAGRESKWCNTGIFWNFTPVKCRRAIARFFRLCGVDGK